MAKVFYLAASAVVPELNSVLTSARLRLNLCVGLALNKKGHPKCNKQGANP